MTQQDWQRVWAVIQSASELPPEQRGTFVEQSLPGDALRQTALELLSESDDNKMTGPAKEPTPPADPPTWHLVGKSLGRFDIVAPIGVGGMSEVYRGFDPDLGRYVAIKCIARRRLGTASAVADFTREARLASAVNHPGIVTIHEVIRTRDTVAIVMELAEGDTLRKQCGSAQPFARVAAVGRQIAEALAASHSAGLIHRDIKPENLMLRQDGLVKILDFGLARRDLETAESDHSRFAGTLRYMSPEQARGGELTPATDIFSLGIVLYELAAGFHPFGFGPGIGNSTMTVAQAIAASDAQPLASVTRNLPAEFTTLVDAMLDRLPAGRPSAAQAAARLAQIAAGRQASIRHMRFVAGGAAAIVALTLVLALIRPFDRTAQQGRPLRITPFTTYTGLAVQPAFSPDGSRIAFTWYGPDGTNRDIYWQAIGETAPHRLTTDPAEDFNPVYSPDGRRIAFFRQTAAQTEPQVVIVPAAGGPERVVGKVAVLSGYRGIAWWPDGQSLLVRDNQAPYGAVVRLFLDDGRKMPFSRPPESQADGMPVVSPDGARVAFARYRTDGCEICWSALRGGNARCVARAAGLTGVAWHRGSRAIYYSDGAALWRVDLDRQGAQPYRIADGNFRDLATDSASKHFAFSRVVSDSNLWRIGRNGGPAARLIASSGEDSDPSWSPDGSRIVMRSNRSGAYELYMYGADGAGERQLTHFGSHLGSPRWSPDGQWIAFDGNRAPVDPTIHHHNIFVVPAGGGDFRRVTDDRYNYLSPNWSRDGHWIYFSQESIPSETRKVPAAGGPSVPVGDGMFDIAESSDGQYFYFTKYDGPSGIWRRPVAGGPDTLLRGTEGVHLFRYWDLTRGGIFFVDDPKRPVLHFLDFHRRRAEKIADLPPTLFYGPRALAAAPDGSAVAYTLRDVTMGDIMLIADIQD